MEDCSVKLSVLEAMAPLAAARQSPQILLQSHHDWLGFWVTKSAIKFDDLGQTLAINHESGVQKPLYSRPSVFMPRITG